VEDILIKFGKCCQPVPGDPIIGYITQGYGVTVHRSNCVNALRSSPDRQIEVEWNTDATETYPAKIEVISLDRMGLLADLVGNISKLGANILHASSDTKDNRMVESHFTINVQDKEHLDRILSAMRRVKHVQDAKRVI
jgi:GTP pyrophosphokinase